MPEKKITIKINEPKSPPPPKEPRRGPFGPVPSKPGSWEREQREKTGY